MAGDENGEGSDKLKDGGLGKKQTKPPELDKKAKAEEYLKTINECIESRVDKYDVVKLFANKVKFSRGDIIKLETVVTSYNVLREIDRDLAAAHMKWLSVCDKSCQMLEEEDHKFKPSSFDVLLDEYGEIEDKVKENFKVMLTQFPDKEEVTSLLKQYRTQPESQTTNPGLIPDCMSTGSSKQEDYVKKKVLKLQDELKTKFTNIQSEHDLGTERNIPVPELIRQLDYIDIQLGEFVKLLERYFGIEDTQEEDYDKYDTWRSELADKVSSLRGNLNKMIPRDKEKSGFMTLFKKRDPPSFKGDVLEYVEWKDKWKAQITANKPDQVYELDILKENIPEQGRKKLFGCESLSKAWTLLDKIYGDTKLITQKLKKILKNLKPVSSEDHEIVIELQEEIDYLVKRLKPL